MPEVAVGERRNEVETADHGMHLLDAGSLPRLPNGVEIPRWLHDVRMTRPLPRRRKAVPISMLGVIRNERAGVL